MADKCALHQVSRPDVKEVHKVLNAWGGIIVHFSGVPPGTSTPLNLQFPDDLKHVLAGNAQGGISCSTVRPGDVFEGPQRNSWGCIGVIVRSRTPWSLVGVDAHDCGSRMEPDGLRWCAHADNDLCLEEVLQSLEQRSATDCNEWVVRDYDILGILIQPPLSARAFGQVATREEITAAFSAWSWFTIRPDGLYVVARDFKLERKTSVGELYPLSAEGDQVRELALWKARSEALTFLRLERPAQIEVLEQLFVLADDCIDAYEAQDSDLYSTVCGLTTLKAKNLALGMYGLTLDGLAQEAGALARPFIEYAELLTYFRMFPDAVHDALAGELPSAGKRAKKIQGFYQPFREHLNEHASHAAYSSHALAHLRDPTTKQLKKLQLMHPEVVERNVGDFAIQFVMMLQESILALEHSPETSRMTSLAKRADELRARILDWFPAPTTVNPVVPPAP